MYTHDDVEIRPLVVPDSLDAADAADFIAMTSVRNQIYREVSGFDDDSETPEELLPRFRPSPDRIQHAWLMLDDGAPIGRAGVTFPQEEGSRTGWWYVELLASAYGRGIGSRAYAVVEQVARAAGRSILHSGATHPASDAAPLASPTGFGSVPRDNITAFYLKHGYTLGQVERCSVLDLTTSPGRIEALHDEAAAASQGYRVVTWVRPTPEEYLDGYAIMKSRMSTDVPAGDLEIEEEYWDAARVKRKEAETEAAGQTVGVTAAQHLASGQLTAFNELMIGTDPAAASEQWDTLVLKGHRGHRLGMLVKTVGILAWRDAHPETPRIITYNAEENRPMLDINEAIGFVPRSYSSMWQKTLE